MYNALGINENSFSSKSINYETEFAQLKTCAACASSVSRMSHNFLTSFAVHSASQPHGLQDCCIIHYIIQYYSINNITVLFQSLNVNFYLYANYLTLSFKV